MVFEMEPPTKPNGVVPRSIMPVLCKSEEVGYWLALCYELFGKMSLC